MQYNDDLVAEMNLLVLFPMHSDREGIKVHSNAETSMVDAAKRLFEKGLISAADGGYLTSTGHEAVEHAKSVLRILTGDYRG
ncbi:TIGR02647 family protein [Thaumasiovibrio subtropicus]|uniref:TIGR02647 family protein n=1 Tax=Thaumasiovibrio subtropicus TaxID=1891207 RepID=UPI000B354CE6|nr:TIGR02647 family protein [Thaumasiovibrio subtropicus]